MRKLYGVLLTIFFLQASAHAADKIRIGFPDLAAQFLPLPLAELKGFFQEEGLQAEFIRIRPAISAAALVSAEIDYDKENSYRYFKITAAYEPERDVR